MFLPPIHRGGYGKEKQDNFSSLFLFLGLIFEKVLNEITFN